MYDKSMNFRASNSNLWIRKDIILNLTKTQNRKLLRKKDWPPNVAEGRPMEAAKISSFTLHSKSVYQDFIVFDILDYCFKFVYNVCRKFSSLLKQLNAWYYKIYKRRNQCKIGRN